MRQAQFCNHNTYFKSTMKIMHPHDEDNIDVNAFNAMKEDLKQLNNQTNHRLTKWKV